MFHDPWYLLLLLLLPVLAWRRWRSRHTEAVPFSSAVSAFDLPPSWRQRLAWLPGALSFAAITLLILALARPRQGREQTVVESEGIAIELVVDRSGSMQAMDFQIGGQEVDRLTAIKKVVSNFVLGTEDAESSAEAAQEPLAEPVSELDGRASDLVGLVAFARFADPLTPPTLDHAFLIAQLSEVEIARHRSEDGTAIGDALALAVEKLQSLDRSRDEKIQSKIIILLTDGENNSGEIDPVQAAELAETLGVKIYTIGVGTQGQAPVPARHPLTGERIVRWVDVTIDDASLKKIARLTGGKYYRATDTRSLQAIYDEIDQLETTKVEARHFFDYREWAVQPVHWGRWQFPPLALAALWMLAARLLVDRLVLRPFG